MKKVLVPVMLAAMLLSTGCGGVAQEVNEARHEVAEEVQEAKNDVTQTVNQITGQSANVDAKFSLGGIFPGMNFDEAKKILGEPTAQYDEDEFAFSNGLTVDVEFNNIEEIKLRQAGIKTAQGIEVGMPEQSVIDAYGAGLTEHDDGLVEHKYYSDDNRLKLKFYSSNGVIVEIKSSLRD